MNRTEVLELDAKVPEVPRGNNSKSKEVNRTMRSDGQDNSTRVGTNQSKGWKF